MSATTVERERYLYRANGLTFDSEIALPELMSGSGPADVVIRYGSVPERVDAPLATGPWYQAARGCYLLKVPHVAEYWAADGCSITVAPNADASEDDVRVFLIASVLGAVAHQSGFLPLHATAVRVDDGCVLLAGTSGAGKSTLAAAFTRRGHALVAEDLCAISLDADGNPVVHPGYRNLKLWADAIDHFGSDFGPGRRIRGGLAKFSIPLDGDADARPERIRGVYVLAAATQGPIALAEIHGKAKFEQLRRQTYRRRLTKGCGDPVRHFALTHALARHAPLVEVRRPLDLGQLDDVVSRLEDDLRSRSES